MEQKEKKKLFLIFGLILLLACYVDITETSITENGYIERGSIGEDERTIRLLVDIGSAVEDYVLEFEIEPIAISKEEANGFFQEAREEIDTDFLEFQTQLPIKEAYADDFVEAEWTLAPEEYVKRDGTLILTSLPEAGAVIQVKASLSCGEYAEDYAFPVVVDPSKISKKEVLVAKLKSLLNDQMQKKDEKILSLPENVNGENVIWSEEKEYLVLKILLLEIVAVVVIQIAIKQKKEDEEKQRKQEIELSYSEVVGQLTILLQAGMTPRQAWSKIANQTMEKTRTGKTQGPMEEALFHLNQMLKDGEKERVAYERFAKELDVVCYRRLVRVLIGNLEKGTGDICAYLEEESQKAYEERILLAKKLGEEASTRMLLPLMLMMLLVMVIVMAPAVFRFSI